MVEPLSFILIQLFPKIALGKSPPFSSNFLPHRTRNNIYSIWYKSPLVFLKYLRAIETPVRHITSRKIAHDKSREKPEILSSVAIFFSSSFLRCTLRIEKGVPHDTRTYLSMLGRTFFGKRELSREFINTPTNFTVIWPSIIHFWDIFGKLTRVLLLLHDIFSSLVG